MSQPLNIELLAAFMTIATSANPAKINDAIIKLEAQFLAHMDTINQFIDLEPEAALQVLKFQYPDHAKLLSSPLAPRAAQRIQAYLKQKGATNGEAIT